MNLEFEFCVGGADTKALLPGFRFRFNLFRSRADNAEVSSGVGVVPEAVGEGAAGEGECE